MKINYIELEDGDSVIVSHNIGEIPSVDVDSYCTPIVDALSQVFGKGRVILLPVRTGETWEFTVVKK